MPRTVSLVITGCLLALSILPASDAHAVKLRRPYDTNVALGYGFDNNYGGAGCTDYNCGGTCYDGHGGSDFPLVVGSTVRAAASGTVVATYNGCANYGYVGNTCGGGCGNYVKIQHSDGQFTLYCHMRRGSLTVSNGASVDCGDKIGETASSGSSSGPHLHMSWRTSSNADRDAYAGSCTTSPGAWRQQNGYGQPVGTSCGCTPSTEVCDGVDNDCDGAADDGEVCEVDHLIQAASSYAPATTTDVNGDGLQDICGRFGSGWGCYLSTGNGWGEKIQTDKMRDDGGWGSPHYYATIRTGDVDGDGLADVCARHSRNGYQCWRSTGTGFEHYANADGYTNDEGWTDPGYYTTFRLADINGDERDDVCARGPQGWSCRLSTGSGFGQTVDGPDWSDASGYNHAWYYGTIRTGDIDADGLDDVCIRHSQAYRCYTSNGQGFDMFADLTDFSNDGGWKDIKYWTTIRLADYDGDGRDDVCARFYSGWRCLRSTDAGFDAPEPIAELSVEQGWDDPSNYATFRTGDINGDGGEDLCARANAGVRCYGLENGQTFSVEGPEWSDDVGWAKPMYYQTMFVTDLDEDRRRDLCARSSLGLTCRLSTDDGFAPIDRLDDFKNDGSWNEVKYYSTLRLGQGECRPEQCNDFDDDCDGEVDEDACTSEEDAGGGGDAGAEDTGASDDVGSTDDVGSFDAGTSSPDAQGGDIGHTDAENTGGASSFGGKAGCAVGGGSARPLPFLFVLLIPLLVVWRRRSALAAKRVAATALVCGLAAAGCEQAPPTDKANPTEEQSAKSKAALTHSEVSSDARLLAIYGKWQLRGVLQPVPPRSDATPRYETELLHDGKPVAWPLDDEFVTNAVFVPGETPSLAARMPDDRLLLVDLKASKVTEIDNNVGFSVAAAQSGCCLTYMSGDMGMQSRMHVYRIDGEQRQSIALESNGWSPAISPDGSQVSYVAPASDASTAMYVHNFDDGSTRQLGVDDERAFPAGPQPPFWTDEGIAFKAEAGAFVLALDGRVLAQVLGASGLLVDFSSGRILDASGADLDVQLDGRADQ